MILGYILLFSVSATLKVCIYIIAHKKLMSSGSFKYFYQSSINGLKDSKCKLLSGLQNLILCKK